MEFLDDPGEMTAAQRLREIAGILAVGYLRLREQRTLLASEAAPSTENPLDCSRAPNPPLGDGLTGREPEENSG